MTEPKRTSWNKVNDEYADLDIPAKTKYVLRHRDRARISNKISMSKRPKEYQRDKHLKHKFGMTYNDYFARLVKQDFKCPICSQNLVPYGKLTEVACVDHDHTTDKIRDLLCNRCNTTLGKVEEKKDILQNMITYLNKWSVNE